LHNIQGLGGKVVSATTDGFITDIGNLEEVILNKPENKFSFFKENKFSIFKEFKNMRKLLSDNDLGLELKHEGIGIISWTTRGQFGKDAGIKASTGFQTKDLNNEELDILFKDTMNSKDKKIMFIQKSLRSALDIYKQGGHVTPVFKDRIFRMHYDNRRTIIIPKDLEEKFKENTVIDYTNILLDSEPIDNVKMCDFYRYFDGLCKKTIYHKNSSPNGLKSIYKSYLELAIRNFLKGLMKNRYNLDHNAFNSYKDLIDYIKLYDCSYNITPNYLSQLKRRDLLINKSVIKTKETLDFVKFIKEKFPNFDEESFFSK